MVNRSNEAIWKLLLSETIYTREDLENSAIKLITIIKKAPIEEDAPTK